MSWTCQHDDKGFCKLLKVPCVPGIKGCTLNKGASVVFSSGDYEKDKEKKQELDFKELAKKY